jgi:flagellar P-ring protein precursor FlgI
MLRVNAVTPISRLGRLSAVFATVFLLATSAVPSRAQDAASPSAVAAEDGLLVGVGLVIGLPGTGDSTVDQKVVEASIVGVLKRAGLEPWRDQIKPGRIAVVLVSAELPQRSTDGARIDINVSALGDARSLAGGTLLVAPLRDAAGVVHAIGQGPIAMQTSAAGTVQGAIAGPRAAEIADGAVIGRRKPQQGNVASLDPTTLTD